MSKGKRLTRKDYQEAHKHYTFKRFACSGSCGIVVEALSAGDVFCCQPGCRGVMKPSYPASAKRLADDQFEAARDRDETPRFTPHFLRVFRSEKAQKPGSGVNGHPSGFQALCAAFELVAQQLAERAHPSSTAEIRFRK